ncbi:hypothetical protein HZF24_17675 [Sedimentibacter hydroxybenzoicus DSM 7310]|uniref:ABC-2 family transporter protein n=1 Tax=Sedimentibacter hydroxybenzoicus DSM 7310 TaxID=1123245 RepID=A0A974GY82_SEDHY|nr:hypothetical protein [Sedimentibacter hydroxybenzoicus]NYB75981.1 hypothetical protein [Sedimentibacter hydroxybenzoicus DSM 7310]
MLNLIKYELIKKYKLFSIAIIFSLGLNVYHMTKGAGGSIFFIAFFPMIAGILYIVDVIRMYSDDLNKKSGYMLFMTPNSGYKIIVSKLITSVIEGFAILLIYFIFILINGVNIAISSGTEIVYSQIIRLVNSLLSGSFGINLGHIFVFLFAVLTFIIAFITTVYAAMTIRKSIFSEVKFGGLLSFIIFMLLNWVISSLSGNFFEAISPYYESISNTMSMGRISPADLAMVMLPMIGVSIFQIVALTGVSGYLLENKINL